MILDKSQLFPAKCGQSYHTHYLQDLVRCNDVCKGTGSLRKKSLTHAESALARFSDTAVKEVQMQMCEPPATAQSSQLCPFHGACTALEKYHV